MAAPFAWQTRVRFVDTDASGRIHFTAMFRFFEAAEQEFLGSKGLRYHRIEVGHVAYPRVRVECNYTGALTSDDIVTIAVSVERIGKTSFTLAFRAECEGKPVADGKIVVVCMDRRSQKASLLPEELAKSLAEG